MKPNCSTWGSHISDCEECGLLDCNAVYFLEGPMFRRNISPPCSRPKIKPSKKPAHRTQLASYSAGLLLGLFFDLKMKALFSFETLRSLVITPHCKPEEPTLNTNCFIGVRYFLRSLLLLANNIAHARKLFSQLQKSLKISAENCLLYLHPSSLSLYFIPFSYFYLVHSFSVKTVKYITSLSFRRHRFEHRVVIV
jgi:hypothetical protein